METGSPASIAYWISSRPLRDRVDGRWQLRNKHLSLTCELYTNSHPHALACRWTHTHTHIYYLFFLLMVTWNRKPELKCDLLVCQRLQCIQSRRKLLLTLNAKLWTNLSENRTARVSHSTCSLIEFNLSHQFHVLFHVNLCVVFCLELFTIFYLCNLSAACAL